MKTIALYKKGWKIGEIADSEGVEKALHKEFYLSLVCACDNAVCMECGMGPGAIYEVLGVKEKKKGVVAWLTNLRIERKRFCGDLSENERSLVALSPLRTGKLQRKLCAKCG